MRRDLVGAGADQIGGRVERIGAGGHLLGGSAEGIGEGAEEIGGRRDCFGGGARRIGAGGDRLGRSAEGIGEGAEEIGRRRDLLGGGARGIGAGGEEMGGGADLFGEGVQGIETHAEGMGRWPDLFGEDVQEIGARTDPLGEGVQEIGASADPIGRRSDPIGEGRDLVGEAAWEIGPVAEVIEQGPDLVGALGHDVGDQADLVGEVAEEIAGVAHGIGRGADLVGADAEEMRPRGKEIGPAAEEIGQLRGTLSRLGACFIPPAGSGRRLLVDAPPYRSAYRVERRVRDLSPEERALVERRRADYHAHVRAQETGTVHEMLVPIAVSLGAVAFGMLGHNHAAAIAGAGMAMMLVVLYVIARRKARERIAASKGPWDGPEGGWKVQETRVFARSVVCAVSGDEDYAMLLLFEIPRGDWYCVDPLCLPAEGRAGDRDLARAELRLARLWPDGAFLSARAIGEALPWQGASGGAEDYAEAVEKGQVFQLDDGEEPGADALIPEARLPAWVREAVGSGPADGAT